MTKSVSELTQLDDAQIRAAVIARLSSHAHLRVVHEWSVASSCIDVAAISRAEPIMHGYEIKSPRDSCTRLERQASDYSRVFDTMTLVASQRLIPKAKTLIPAWWGIMRAAESNSETDPVELSVVRRAERNPSIDHASLLWLLWHRELLSVVRSIDDAHRHVVVRGGKWKMIEHVMRYHDLTRSKRVVISHLLQRSEWKDVDGGRSSSRWQLTRRESERTQLRKYGRIL